MVFHDDWKGAPVSLIMSAVDRTKRVVSASVGSNGFQRMRRDQLEFAGASNWPLAFTMPGHGSTCQSRIEWTQHHVFAGGAGGEGGKVRKMLGKGDPLSLTQAI